MGTWLRAVRQVCRNFAARIARGRQLGLRPWLEYRVELDRGELRMLRNGRRVWSFLLRDVLEVAAHKVDLGTVDEIRVAFRLRGDEHERWWWVAEEVEGYQGLVRQLPEWFPGMVPWETWWPKVVTPAFAENWTVLWTAPYLPPAPLP